MARVISIEPHSVALAEAEAVLNGGGTLALPTDTVYGLAALPSMPAATAAIFELKQRPPGMHLAVLVGGADQVSLVSDDDRPGVQALMTAFWPGALTVVLSQATPLVAALNSGDGTIGVRCPEHDFTQQLARRVGPIAATSANLHGQPTPDTGAGVAEALPGADLVLDGPVGASDGSVAGSASTVVSLLGDVPEVLRAGPVTEAQLLDVWHAQL